MSGRPEVNWGRLRTALIPDVVISIVGPVLIYRFTAPYMDATHALLLASVLPLIRIGYAFVRRHRLNVIGIVSLLAILLKVVIALVLKDARLILVSDSLITAVYGILMLASLLTGTPLLMWLIRSILANADPTRSEQLMRHWQETRTRAFFATVTAAVGLGLLLECLVRVAMALTMPIEQFLVISPLVRYGFLGVLLLWVILFTRMRNRKQQKQREQIREQLEHDLYRVEKPVQGTNEKERV